MSKIDDLIAKLCPNGVEYKTLGKICIIKTGQSVNKIMIQNNPGEFPVINSGRTPLGFINTFNTKDDPIGITSRGAGVGSITWCEGKYFRGNLNYSSTIKSINQLTPRFLYHYLIEHQISIQNLATYDGIPALNACNLKKLSIPIPPLEIQREIVKVLDTFTKLEAELEAELEARRRQYHYYRDQLLNFEGRDDVQWMTLGEIGTLVRGNGMPKSDFEGTGVGCIHYGQIYTYYGIWTAETISCIAKEKADKLAKVDHGDIIITNTSENIDDVCKAVAWLGNSQIVTGGHATVLKHDQNPKYISYYLKTPAFFAEKKKYATGTKVIDVSAKNLGKIKIPVPSLKEQARIVAILDKFDALVNDLSSGLPAEIAARRKQYEYYRDRLLTFKEAQ